MKTTDALKLAVSAPQHAACPNRRWQSCADLHAAGAAAKRGILESDRPDSAGLNRSGKARMLPHHRQYSVKQLGRTPVAPDPAAPTAPPCPTPGFNGAHYFVEVDPASGAPRPFTGYLRCKWCGAGHRAADPPSFRHRHVRRLRPVSREELFRAVLEAL